ncbi:MAG: metallophosphoesterase family protein [Candidatus Binatia bacterium]
MKCLFATDLHGNRAVYDRLLDRAAGGEVDAVLLGGDLSPLEPPLDVLVEKQRRFWLERLVPWAEKIVGAGVRLIVIHGNNDLAANDDCLARGEAEGRWELAHDRVLRLGDVAVVGNGNISLTPFILKDREYFDREPGRLEDDASLALDDPHAIYTAPRATPAEPTLADQLRKTFALVPSGLPTILLAHCPPRDTRLDRIHGGVSVGSWAVRQAIETHRPLVALHGHIHESPDAPGGGWRDEIGATIAVNPGSEIHLGAAARLRLVAFDTADVAGTIAYERL